MSAPTAGPAGPQSPQPSQPERAAPSRELADFLIELSIALHKHAMYPEGHPSLAPAAAGVVRRAAKLLFQADEDLDVAIVVAYEHHIMINGGGYPALHYGRACHHASTLVHVCDVYDALRTHRPYRDAWSFEKTLGYLEERSGLEFDPALVTALVRMMRQWEVQPAAIPEPEPAKSELPGV